MVMPEVSPTDLPRVGPPLHRIFRVGSRILRRPTQKWKVAEHRHPGTRLQVDPHPVSMLEG